MCGEKRILLAKPQTFMNLSGQAVDEIMQFYKIPPERLLVMCDDISLDPGKLRIRRKGSHGGQNGMRNIIDMVESSDFCRIKLGIGAKPHPDYNLADWVLSHACSTVTQTERKGTGHAVMMAKSFLEAHRGGSVLILNGDAPFMDSRNISNSFYYHEAQSNCVTVISAMLDDPTGYGRILRAADGRLMAIVEPSYLSSTPAAAISASAVSTTNFLTNLSSLTSPTSGIMISGSTFQSGCFF